MPSDVCYWGWIGPRRWDERSESFETNHLIRSQFTLFLFWEWARQYQLDSRRERTSLAPLAVSRSPRRVEMCGQQGDGVMRGDTKSKYFIKAGAQ
jgi:hypothetical protein